MSDINDIYKKLDEIASDITEIKVSQARTEVDVAHHIERTDSLQVIVERVESDLRPVEDHVKFMQGGLKLFGIVALALSALVSVLKIFSVI